MGVTFFFLSFFLTTLAQNLGLCGWPRPNLIGGCRFRASVAGVPESGSHSVPGSLETGHLDESEFCRGILYFVNFESSIVSVVSCYDVQLPEGPFIVIHIFIHLRGAFVQLCLEHVREYLF